MNRLARLQLEIFAGAAVFTCSVFLTAQTPAAGPVTNPASTPAAHPTQNGTRTFTLALQQPLVYRFDASPDGSACPIYMQALQTGGGNLLNARDSRPGEFSQHIHLILGNSAGTARIVAIEVSIYGTSGKNRAVPALVARGPAWDARKTFDLTINIGENEEASTNLTLRGFTSVQSINLESVTYADGSIWSRSLSRSCRIAPDPLMLIGSR
jgi:hypothetical protein